VRKNDRLPRGSPLRSGLRPPLRALPLGRRNIHQTDQLQAGKALSSCEVGRNALKEREPEQDVRARLSGWESQEKAALEESATESELRFLVGQFQTFANKVIKNLEEADWDTRRDLIRMLVKRIEIDNEDVNIVFRVGPPPSSPGSGSGGLQHCGRRDQPTAGQSLYALCFRCLDGKGVSQCSIRAICR